MLSPLERLLLKLSQPNLYHYQVIDHLKRNGSKIIVLPVGQIKALSGPEMYFAVVKSLNLEVYFYLCVDRTMIVKDV